PALAWVRTQPERPSGSPLPSSPRGLACRCLFLRQPDRRSNQDRCQNLLLPCSFAPSRRASSLPAVGCALGFSAPSAGLAFVPIEHQSSTFDFAEQKVQRTSFRLNDHGLTAVVQTGQDSMNDAPPVQGLAQLQSCLLASETPVVAQLVQRALQA